MIPAAVISSTLENCHPERSLAESKANCQTESKDPYSGSGPRMLTCALVLLVVTGVFSFAQTGQGIEAAAKTLGQGGDPFARIQLLAKEPAKSAGLLISELRVVDRAMTRPEKERSDTEHVLWSVRALRFITGGKDFCSSTKYQFGKSELEQNRKYFLTLKNHDCLPFFALWPSRGIDYIAPPDVQTKIISRWKSWYETEGRTYRYRPLVNPRPEDWSW